MADLINRIQRLGSQVGKHSMFTKLYLEPLIVGSIHKHQFLVIYLTSLGLKHSRKGTIVLWQPAPISKLLEPGKATNGT